MTAWKLIILGTGTSRGPCEGVSQVGVVSTYSKPKSGPQDSMLLDEDFTTVDADLIFARVKSRLGQVEGELWLRVLGFGFKGHQ